MTKHVILLCVSGLITATAVFAAEPAGDPIAVWEISAGSGVARVQLLSDGSTDAGSNWDQNLAQLTIGDGGYTIEGNGRSFAGRHKGGAVHRGRLLMVNIMLKHKSAVPVLKQPEDVGNNPDATFADKLVGAWELTALNRKKDKQLYLSLDLTEKGDVLDEDRLIATWKVEDKTKVVVDFVDERFDNALLRSRNADTLFGKTKTDGDTWVLTLQRILPVAFCATDSMGKITLYSNGRTDGTNGTACRTYWKLDGQKLTIFDYSCDLEKNLTFKGRGSYGRGIEGTIVFAPKK